MKIVFISDWFSESMGYSENNLPKALAKLGHEVHIVTSNVQVYFDAPFYKETYESFIGPPIVSCCVKNIDGVTVHRLPYIKIGNQIGIKGLTKKIFEIKPHIVQVFEVLAFTTVSVVISKLFLGYKVFLESRMHASIFPIANRTKIGFIELIHLKLIFILGRIISLSSEKCYPVAADVKDIAIRFLGIQPEKLEICSLGVDTDVFHPIVNDKDVQMRQSMREKFQFTNKEIVCIYTGRFSNDKNPLCLARAIQILTNQGLPFRGLFVGDGPQEKLIRNTRGCLVVPFVFFKELPSYYWAADVGVWPKQESTSQLDAMACGLPIVVNNNSNIRERWEGNGLTYQEDDCNDLAEVLKSMMDVALRNKMGAIGVRKIIENYSWNLIAKQRQKDYQSIN